MLKELIASAAAVTAGLIPLAGHASAQGGPETDTTFGLVNASNVDALHNVNVNLGVCGNDINVLGVLVDAHDLLNGVGVPILSQGNNTAASAHPEVCAANSNIDGGTYQDD